MCKKNQYLIAACAILAFPSGVFAETFGDLAPNGPQQFAQIMTMVFVSFVVVFVIGLLFWITRVNKSLINKLIEIEAARRGVVLPTEAAVYAPQNSESLFSRLRKKYWNNPVPIDQEGTIDLNHDYDGIRELDNNLPPWWVSMFIITVIWAAGYMWYYHMGGGGAKQLEEYTATMKAAEVEKALFLTTQLNSVDESTVKALSDKAALADGQQIFTKECAACHGKSGEGLVGPNMTDDNWLHGGGIKNVFKTIKYGVPDKGMREWASQYSASDIQKVASYILTLKGTNPANPKAPQGEIWVEEAVTAADSTSTVAPKDSAATQK